MEYGRKENTQIRRTGTRISIIFVHSPISIVNSDLLTTISWFPVKNRVVCLPHLFKTNPKPLMGDRSPAGRLRVYRSFKSRLAGEWAAARLGLLYEK